MTVVYMVDQDTEVMISTSFNPVWGHHTFPDDLLPVPEVYILTIN